MLSKVAPGEYQPDTGEYIEHDHDSVKLRNPQLQRDFNDFRLWNSSLIFHILVLVSISVLNIFFIANTFHRPITVAGVLEVALRIVAIVWYALFSMHHFWLEKKVSCWSRWAGRLKSNVICNVGMLNVMAISVVQIFTVLEIAKEDRDIAVTFCFAVFFQAIIVRLLFPAADWWAGPLVCMIACGLCSATAIIFKLPFQLIVQQVFLFSVCVFSDYDHYKRNLHHFINYKNLGHATKTALENEQKQKQAEYASKEMRSFIGNIAHDLKTPLQSFVSELDMLSASSSEEGKLVSVSALQSLCSFMLMMINRSLDFVTSESGLTLVPSNSTVNLKESLTWVVDCIQRTSNAVPIVCSEIPSSVCTLVMTDKQWLEENLLCLVSNATKFTTSGTITINAILDDRQVRMDTDEIVTLAERSFDQHEGDIEAQRTSSVPVEMLLFEVEDTGIGLSEEQMKSLFQPFQQAQRKAGGTGLGLYALARRVDAIGGRYGVRGRRDGGNGCLFWFTIPYRPDFASSVLMSAPSVKFNFATDSTFCRNSCSSRDSVEHTPLKVLVVDDSPLIQKTTSRILRNANHIVSSAMNGALCLDVLAERGNTFDVILMDIQMPVMDGLETIRRIREKEAAGAGVAKGGHRQFVIGLSANSDNETRATAMEAGMDDFVSKPLTLAMFDKVVARLVAVKSMDLYSQENCSDEL